MIKLDEVVIFSNLLNDLGFADEKINLLICNLKLTTLFYLCLNITNMLGLFINQ